MSHDFIGGFWWDSVFLSLMMSAYAGHVQMVKELRHCQDQASYEARDNAGSTAFHYAMDSKNTELIDHMIDDGADVNCRDDKGWTPLARVGECITFHHTAQCMV